MILTHLCCSNENGYYKVQVTNNYFEVLEGVTIDTFHFGAIDTSSTSNVKVIKSGSYQFKARTASSLLLNADIFLYGRQEDVLLLVNHDGRLVHNY